MGHRGPDGVERVVTVVAAYDLRHEFEVGHHRPTLENMLLGSLDYVA
jgi:hypothetical protein